MTSFANFLRRRVSSSINTNRELRNLGPLIDLHDLPPRYHRSGRAFLSIPNRPQISSSIPNLPAINSEPNSSTNSLNRINSIRRHSFDDLISNISTMSNHEEEFQEDNGLLDHFAENEPDLQPFNRTEFYRFMTPYRGDAKGLPIFIRRAEAFIYNLTPLGKRQFLSHLIFKLEGKAFTIYESQTYHSWDTLKRALQSGIKVPKSPSALQTELMNMRQIPSISAKHFADQIKEKLRELNDVIESTYDNQDVLDSFRTEFMRVAIRTYREGLLPPLKFRIQNFDAYSLDELVRKTVEEEPFVKVITSSLDDANNEPSSSNNSRQVSRWQQNNFSQRNNSQSNRNFMNQNPRFQRANSFNRNNDFYNNNQRNFANNTSQNNPSNNNFQHQQNRNDTKMTCTRCNRVGHRVENCYVRQENLPNIQRVNQNNNQTPRNVNKISFLGLNRERRHILGKGTPIFSDKVNK